MTPFFPQPKSGVFENRENPCRRLKLALMPVTFVAAAFIQHGESTVLFLKADKEYVVPSSVSPELRRVVFGHVRGTHELPMGEWTTVPPARCA